ncbi:MAG: lysoplasmalogenase [Deltaproteobacteria bacterium]|nr:lysoplasmalogenase [Deltaproteobacteria bacterium]
MGRACPVHIPLINLQATAGKEAKAMTQRVCIGIFLLFGAAYIGLLPVRPYPGSFLVKALPVLALAYLALSSVKGIRGRLLTAALVLSAGGDIALAVGEGVTYFMAGLVLFLFAHLVYTALFAMDFHRQLSRLSIVILLVLYSTAMGCYLKPTLGPMTLPVFFYLAVITVMASLAAFRSPPGYLVLAGALLFMASDSLLAVNRFRMPLPAADLLVMATYYAAQFCIAWGFVSERPSSPP